MKHLKFHLILLTAWCFFWYQYDFYAENKRESDYQKIAAELLNGKTEVVLSDRTRIDIVTDDQAIEVDWSYKWAEGIGQALYYSSRTNKEPGLILIVKDIEKEQKYVDRVKTVIKVKSLRIFLYIFDVKAGELRRIE